MTRVADHAGPVFVRGTGRCGTTMLLRQLDRHSRIAALPMDEVLPEDLCHWCDHRLAGPLGDDARRAVPLACRAFLEAIGRATAGPHGVLLHKGTMKAHLMERLLQWWPDARIVYLVRHPLGVVPSMINADLHRFRGRFGYRATVANSLLRWANDVIVYLGSGAFGHPRVHQVTYESLVADRDDALAGIHRFIGVPPRRWEPIAGRERYERPVMLRPDQRRWIVEVTRDLTERLGYGPDDSLEATGLREHDTAPPPVAADVERMPPAIDGAELLSTAVGHAETRGHRRLAVFGAGYLTRLVAPRLDERHDAVVAVLDEDPTLAGTSIASRPVAHADAASSLAIDAVIPMTLVHQARLIRRWQTLAPSIPIIPLWAEEQWMDELVRPSAPSLVGSALAGHVRRPNHQHRPPERTLRS